MGKPIKKQLPGKDGLQRMNFLHQATGMMAENKPEYLSLIALYGSHLVSLGRKLQQKMDPSVKRTLCKGCSGVLTPGISATVRIKSVNTPKLKKHKKFNPLNKVCVWTCLQCKTLRRYPLDPNYLLWSERPESQNKAPS